jgi:hypothetical protein
VTISKHKVRYKDNIKAELKEVGWKVVDLTGVQQGRAF